MQILNSRKAKGVQLNRNTVYASKFYVESFQKSALSGMHIQIWLGYAVTNLEGAESWLLYHLMDKNFKES